MQFLLRIRMERARTLLLTTKLTMEQIAASVGYEDALYFSKLYKNGTSAPQPPTVRKCRGTRSPNALIGKESFRA